MRQKKRQRGEGATIRDNGEGGEEEEISTR
jgi:hypothetical protein